jgi:heterodisulfide reductase subunit A-like polyferredoxin
MNQFDNIVFGNKTFGNLLEEIYDNQKKKDKQVTALIKELQPMIEEIGDATLIVPLIKEYMEIGVKNDDLLIKMAALAQRSMSSTSTESSLGISDEEKQQLLDEINKFKPE